MTPPANAMNPAIAENAVVSIAQPDQGDVFRTIFENAAIGIFESTPAGKYIRVNQALADMLGADSPEHLIAAVNNIGDELYTDPDYRARFIREIERQGVVTNLISKTRRLDGTSFWISETGTALRNEAGEVTSYLGTITDITELIEAQAAQRAAEEGYRRIFENAAEGIYRSTPGGKEIRANPAMARLNGYDTEAELLAAIGNINDEWYVEPGRRREFQRLLAEDGRVENFESEIHRHKTGERIWVSENAWAVRDDTGAIEYYEGTVVEITDRKRAEDDLRLSEARFRDFGEPASDWNWETGPDHEFTYVSDLNKSFGDDSRNILGKTRWDLADDVAGDAEKWRAHRALLDQHKPFRDFVYPMTRSGKRAGFNSVSGKPFFDGDGTFLGYRGSTRDVSELVRAEDNLRQAMADAEAASAAKSHFLANMSHELRTPLNAIIGFSEIIMRELFGPLGSERYRGYMRDINESANLLLELITDILDFSKAESGMLDIEEQPVDIGDDIKWTLRIQAERAERRQVTLVENVPDDLPYLRGDKRRLRQVLLNLVSNAIKFTEAGGRITLCAAREEDGGIVVSVEDTGIGIAEEDIARVLEPFVQLNRPRSLAHEGTGLGLPLCKQLVEFNGGTLSIESKPGEGTKVTMRFAAERSIRR
jgi:two-component system cell cycle sensor histidine kinase PleC